MKLPMTIDYGLRIAIALAREYSRPVSARELARQEQISKKYVEMILGDLRRAGLVSAVRGISGGYALSKPPEKILLVDIVEAVSGRISLFNCLDNPGSCSRINDCPARGIWLKVQKAIKNILAGQNLGSLARPKPVDYII